MTKILMVGDTHGDVPFAEDMCRVANKRGADLIFQVGDWAYVYRGNADKVESLSNVLRQFGLRMAWIDGNHEDYGTLEANWGITPDVTEPVEMNDVLTYYPRGYRWEWDGVSFMALGGANSIDRPFSTPWVDWFPQEEITRAQVERAIAPGGVDVMFTHDAPDCPPILAKFLEAGSEIWKRAYRSRWHYEIEPQSRNHRRTLSSVVDEVKPRLLIHGHYHYKYHDHYGPTQVIGLGQNGTGRDGWILLDTEVLRAEWSRQG